MKTLLLTTSAAALVLVIGAAQAEPVKLGTEALDTVTAGYGNGGYHAPNFAYKAHIDKKLGSWKTYDNAYFSYGFADIYGYIANAEAVADAYGDGAAADTFSGTFTAPGVASAYSTSSSSSSPSYFAY
ncbi:MAG: hypothetical protein ACFB3T_05860 [Geminicoccaceae bacterium]